MWEGSYSELIYIRLQRVWQSLVLAAKSMVQSVLYLLGIIRILAYAMKDLTTVYLHRRRQRLASEDKKESNVCS